MSHIHWIQLYMVARDLDMPCLRRVSSLSPVLHVVRQLPDGQVHVASEPVLVLGSKRANPMSRSLDRDVLPG